MDEGRFWTVAARPPPFLSRAHASRDFQFGHGHLRGGKGRVCPEKPRGEIRGCWQEKLFPGARPPGFPCRPDGLPGILSSIHGGPRDPGSRDPTGPSPATIGPSGVARYLPAGHGLSIPLAPVAGPPSYSTSRFTTTFPDRLSRVIAQDKRRLERSRLTWAPVLSSLGGANQEMPDRLRQGRDRFQVGAGANITVWVARITSLTCSSGSSVHRARG